MQFPTTKAIAATAALSAVAATSVATAAPANAAHGRVWDRIAHCESGGRWHINTGNGYYGGLQISGGTWRAFGGKRLAEVPSRASKGEQIRIGKRIQRHQGWGAWPTCSRRAGVR